MIFNKKKSKKSDFFDLNWIFLNLFAFFSVVVHCCCIKQFKLQSECQAVVYSLPDIYIFYLPSMFAFFNYDCCYKIKRKHLKLKGLKYCKKVF